MEKSLIFKVYFDFKRYLRLENGNLKKNASSKIKSLCHADSKHIFRSKIGQVVFEKNAF
jgi:hypothetical protein